MVVLILFPQWLLILDVNFFLGDESLCFFASMRHYVFTCISYSYDLFKNGNLPFAFVNCGRH